ncbi:unnamed protein product [Ectocarpus sp. 12 AP-2014]
MVFSHVFLCAWIYISKTFLLSILRIYQASNTVTFWPSITKMSPYMYVTPPMLTSKVDSS